MYYLFHDGIWKAFETNELPVKPKRIDYPFQFKWDNAISEYNQAIATLKSKALVVANPQICPQNMSQVKEGEFYEWPGTVEKVFLSKGMNDSDATKFVLHLPKQDMRSKIAKRILDKTPQEVRDEVKAYGDRLVSGDDDIYYLTGPDEFVKGEPTELDDAIETANLALDVPNADPDDALRTVSRHLLRLKEENTRLRKLIEKAFYYGASQNLESIQTWTKFKKDNNL